MNKTTNRNTVAQRQDFRVGDVIVILGEERRFSAFEPAAEVLEVDRLHRLLTVRLISQYDNAEERHISFSDAIDAASRQDKHQYKPGQMVRICSGRYAESHAVVKNVNHRRRKLLLSVTIAGHPAQEVELDAGQVELA